MTYKVWSVTAKPCQVWLTYSVGTGPIIGPVPSAARQASRCFDGWTGELGLLFRQSKRRRERQRGRCR